MSHGSKIHRTLYASRLREIEQQQQKLDRDRRRTLFGKTNLCTRSLHKSARAVRLHRREHTEIVCFQNIILHHRLKNNSVTLYRANYLFTTNCNGEKQIENQPAARHVIIVVPTQIRRIPSTKAKRKLTQNVPEFLQRTSLTVTPIVIHTTSTLRRPKNRQTKNDRTLFASDPVYFSPISAA